MNAKPITNVAASVRQRLLNKAKADSRPFNEVLQYYAMERFLYRLSQSKHSDKFILKGALMLRVWQSPETRPTMDIDMLGITSNRAGDIAAQVADVLATEAAPDGLVFDPQTVETEEITEDADYRGVRVRFRGLLDTARISMQIDIGFGDIIVPGPAVATIPTLLGLDAPRMLCYSRESAIAEKFEAMVKLREVNSRMKDFYDIWLLCREFDFDGGLLCEAIRRTLLHRSTELPDEVVAFSGEFAAEKQTQWSAFRRRLGRDDTPAEFRVVVSTIRAFLEPVCTSLRSGAAFASKWAAPGPWMT